MKLWQIKDLYPKAIQYDPSTQKSLLLKELKGKAGIYCWYNILTEFFYIGSYRQPKTENVLLFQSSLSEQQFFHNL